MDRISAFLGLLITSEMIHHHGVSLSKQQTADYYFVISTQQDLSLSTVLSQIQSEEVDTVELY